MVRPDKLHYFMNIAKVVATRSTCLRRAVGCVLVDDLGHILATGHNGVARGEKHCNEPVTGLPRAGVNWVAKDGTGMDFPNACEGVFRADGKRFGKAGSGKNLDACQAIHAEQNALLQCADVNKISICYCTTSPCLSCVKMLMNTSCQTIWFSEAYPHPEAAALWTKNQHRFWLQLT